MIYVLNDDLLVPLEEFAMKNSSNSLVQDASKHIHITGHRNRFMGSTGITAIKYNMVYMLARRLIQIHRKLVVSTYSVFYINPQFLH